MLARSILTVLALAFAASSLPSSAFASAEYIQYEGRKGRGTYKPDDSEKPTGHSIEIFAGGTTGKYCVDNGPCGDLFEIEFGSEGDDVFGDVRGKWEFNGSRGTFFWSFSEEKKFFGNFRFNQKFEKSEAGSIYVPTDGNWEGYFK